MDNPIENLKVMPSTMAEVLQFAIDMDYHVSMGNTEAIRLSLHLKHIIRACQAADDKIQDHVIDEAEKLHKEELKDSYNATIKQVGTKYFYDDCNDSVYVDILERKKGIDKEEKDRQNFLKNIKAGEVVNPDTGEELYPPAKSSTTKVVFTL